MIKTLKSIILPALIGVSVLALVGLGGSALVLYREASEVHPVLGWAVVGAILLGVVFLLVVPVFRLVALPRGIQKPAVESGKDWEDYLHKYGVRLTKNPVIASEYPGVADLNRAVRTRASDLHSQVELAVAFLDAKAKSIAAAHAAAVFTTTAVSQSGRLDTALVLSAQIRMIKEIAVLYYQRPSLRELVGLYANVGATAFLAGEIEDSEILAVLGAPITAGITGLIPVGGTDPLISLLVNSLLDGSTNAFLTLRVGVLARRHCGVDLVDDRRGLSRAASVEAAGLLAGVVGSGAKRIASVTRKAITKGAVSGPKRAVQSVAGAGSSIVGKVLGMGRKEPGAQTPQLQEPAGLGGSVEFWESVADAFKNLAAPEPRD